MSASHGHYDHEGKLLPDLVLKYGLHDWIIRYSDGKADPALVERWINIPVSGGMIHFFHPGTGATQRRIHLHVSGTDAAWPDVVQLRANPEDGVGSRGDHVDSTSSEAMTSCGKAGTSPAMAIRVNLRDTS